MFVLHLVFVIMFVHSSLSFPLTCTLVVINKSASTNKTKDGIEIIPDMQIDASSNLFGTSTTDTNTAQGEKAASQQPYTDTNETGGKMVTLSTAESSTVTEPKSVPGSPDTTVKETTTTAETTVKGTTNADATAKESSTSPEATVKATTNTDKTVKDTTITTDTTAKDTTITADTTVKETTSIPYYDDENIRVMVDPAETTSTERITIPRSTTMEPPMVLDY